MVYSLSYLKHPITEFYTQFHTAGEVREKCHIGLTHRDRENSGQESSLALLEWNVKALEKSSPNMQRQVLAIASEDQPPSHFVGPNDIQHCTAESSGNTGAGPAMCSERCTRGMAGQ